MSAALGLAALLMTAPVPVRLPAEVDDAYALRFNPAGLGRLDGPELRLFAGRDRSVPDLSNTDYGFGGYAALPVFGAATVGLGVEADAENGDFRRALSLGLGTGRGPLSLGFSYTIDWPIEGEDRGVWSLGAQLRPSRWLSLGFTSRDLSQSVSDRQYDTGLAIRPSPRLTLGVRWRYEENEVLDGDSLDLAFRGEVEPIPGLLVGALGDLDGRFLVQLTLQREYGSVSGQVDVVDDDQIGFTAELALRGYRRPSVLRSQRVAVLDLSGRLRPQPTFSLLRGGFRPAPYGGLPVYLERLRQDDEVVGVLARIGNLKVGWATLQEVRAGLERLRQAGRRVDCQLTGADDKSYFVATACSTIIIPPAMVLAVNGVQAKLLFFGDALERYGVEAEVHRREEYKTSPETFTRSGISSAQRESLGRVLDRIQATLELAMAEGRGLPDAEVRKILRRGAVTATQAVALDMVDAVLYPDEVEKWVRERHRGRITFAQGERALQPERPRWAPPPTIAVIHIDATIVSGSSRNLPFGFGRNVGATSILRALEEARRRPDIKAVVLRVDSPGGGAFASDLIARGVRKVAEEKPVIASFGDVAASGGYYAASGAQVIYAEPTTLTGSIGVFSLRFSVEGLVRRFGINSERLGPGIGSPSPFLDSTAAERRIARLGVDAAYRRFLTTVAEGRKLERAQVEKIARGRVWTGLDAQERGLVDEIGGLVDAIRRARQEAGLADHAEFRISNFPESIEPLPVAIRLAQDAGVISAQPDEAPIWPDGVEQLFGPLLSFETTRSGAPEPLAWFPWSVSVD